MLEGNSEDFNAFFNTKVRRLIYSENNLVKLNYAGIQENLDSILRKQSQFDDETMNDAQRQTVNSRLSFCRDLYRGFLNSRSGQTKLLDEEMFANIKTALQYTYELIVLKDKIDNAREFPVTQGLQNSIKQLSAELSCFDLNETEKACMSESLEQSAKDLKDFVEHGDARLSAFDFVSLKHVIENLQEIRDAHAMIDYKDLQHIKYEFEVARRIERKVLSDAHKTYLLHDAGKAKKIVSFCKEAFGRCLQDQNPAMSVANAKLAEEYEKDMESIENRMADLGYNLYD